MVTALDGPATGDEPQSCVVGVAIDKVRRELRLAKAVDIVNGEDSDGTVGAADPHEVSWVQAAEPPKH
jgi:hypothetical protein